MPGQITKKQIESMRAEFDGDPSAKVAQNAVTGNNVAAVSLPARYDEADECEGV